ncbi:hypothetical protein [Mesorhizobium sp. A623]
MALSPALREIIINAAAECKAKHDAKNEQARELLLDLIGNTLERIRATPDAVLLDYPQEATDLLDTIENWCSEQHEDGYPIFRDPR